MADRYKRIDYLFGDGYTPQDAEKREAELKSVRLAGQYADLVKTQCLWILTIFVAGYKGLVFTIVMVLLMLILGLALTPRLIRKQLEIEKRIHPKAWSRLERKRRIDSDDKTISIGDVMSIEQDILAIDPLYKCYEITDDEYKAIKVCYIDQMDIVMDCINAAGAKSINSNVRVKKSELLKYRLDPCDIWDSQKRMEYAERIKKTFENKKENPLDKIVLPKR